MAPEQFAGKGATVRSDIYSYGLILYEIFTGKKAFTAATIAELRQQKEQHTPRPPSEIRSGLDPVLDRLVLRCLERDPSVRPASVAQLALALPGGDPLAAAIAAGETPSPEMVAAAGSRESVRPVIAWMMLAFIIAAAVLAAALNGRVILLERMPPGKSPDVLLERARNFLKKAGYTGPVVDSAWGFDANRDLLNHLENSDETAGRWRNVGSAAVIFWYRQSPQPLEPSGSLYTTPPYAVAPGDPPMQFSGEALVGLDTQGNVLWFRAVPPPMESSVAASALPDWSALFLEAGLDVSQWTPAPPEWNPLFYADTRAAWQRSSEKRDGPLRIEAASHDGKLISFEGIHAWTRATRTGPPERQAMDRAGTWFLLVVLLSLIVGGLFFARRNLRLGRGDRQRATRLSAIVVLLLVIRWVLQVHYVPTFWQIGLTVRFAGEALFAGAFLWILYIAVEPFVRRTWPQVLISWTRLLAGEWRDPVVGRDVLAGCCLGVMTALVTSVGVLLPTAFGYPDAATPRFEPGGLFFTGLPGVLALRLFVSLGFLCLLFFLRVLLRHDKAAAAAWIALIVLPDTLLGSWALGLSGLVMAPLLFVLLMRCGLLGMTTALVVMHLYYEYPITLQSPAWYAGTGYAAHFVVAVIVLFGFWTSFGGRRVLDTLSLEG
jgi:serine/threonine-protein kinase